MTEATPRKEDDFSRPWKPVPDPTDLTTLQSRDLREEMYRAIEGLQKLIESRIHTLDTSVTDFHQRLPSLIDSKGNDLRGLFDEKLKGLREEANQKFAGVALQFTERDVRGDQAAKASETAIAAAFSAYQKAADANAESSDKAINKSETATKEKIDALQALLTGSINDIRGQIATLTSRQDRTEGATKGVTDVSYERRGNIGMIVGLSTLASIMVSMIVSAVIFVAVHAAPAPAPAPAISYGAPTVVSPAVVPVQPK